MHETLRITLTAFGRGECERGVSVRGGGGGCVRGVSVGLWGVGV